MSRLSRREPETYSSFQWRVRELDDIKTEVVHHLGRLNSLKLDYMDWFSRRRQTFLDAIKLVQISLPHLVPQTISSIGDFRKTIDLVGRLPRLGRPVEGCVKILDEYLVFWTRLSELHLEGRVVYGKLCQFVDGVSAMREPHIKVSVDELQTELNAAMEEMFDFTSVHNERDNLFTYKLAQQDHRFHGLLAYIPFLLKIATNICYWSNKMYLEKE